MHTTEGRILACLIGIATGDAVGKQTENLSGDEVLRWYPSGVRGFEGPPGTDIPRYRRNKKRAWLIGETTDDTERTLAVARAIVRDGEVRHTSVGGELLMCRKCVHPGVPSLWEFHEAADPARIAERHDGCGAAVRVAPVGMRYRPDRLEDIVAAAREASIPTHGGPLAIAAAAATAAAVSAAVEALPPGDIIDLARWAAATAERERTDPPTTLFAAALDGIVGELTGWRDLHAAAIGARYFPNGPLTIVPLALALGTLTRSAHTAILLATNIGGDSDSVASIAGGVAAAINPASVSGQWATVVDDVNHHELVSIAEALAILRQ
jgi:ADP-ribosylglycohydrolase